MMRYIPPQMLKFVSFPTTDIDAVNAFLEANGDRIGQDSITYQGDRVCFIYRDKEQTPAEEESELLLAFIKKHRQDTLAETLAMDLNERFHQMLVLRGASKPENVVEAANQKRNLKGRLQIIAAIAAKVAKGEWGKE